MINDSSGRTYILVLTDDGSDYYAVQRFVPDQIGFLVVGNDNSIYITGYTTPNRLDPTPGAFQTTPGGADDAYVMRVRYIDVAKASVYMRRIN